MDNQIKSALDAAGTAADYSARATYQRGFDAGVASVEAREWALGVQVVAQAERLKLADDVVAAARVFVDEDNWQTCPHCAGEGANPDDHKGETRCPVCCGGLQSYRDDRADCAETSITAALTALAAWDAVPGMEP